MQSHPQPHQILTSRIGAGWGSFSHPGQSSIIYDAPPVAVRRGGIQFLSAWRNAKRPERRNTVQMLNCAESRVEPDGITAKPDNHAGSNPAALTLFDRTSKQTGASVLRLATLDFSTVSQVRSSSSRSSMEERVPSKDRVACSTHAATTISQTKCVNEKENAYGASTTGKTRDCAEAGSAARLNQTAPTSHPWESQDRRAVGAFYFSPSIPPTQRSSTIHVCIEKGIVTETLVGLSMCAGGCAAHNSQGLGRVGGGRFLTISPPEKGRMKTYGDVQFELTQAQDKINKLEAKLNLALPALEKALVYLPFAWRGTPDEQELKVAIMQLKETI